MNKILILVSVLLIGVSCNQNNNNSPAPSSPTPSATCQSSTWKYEVILATPCNQGAFYIEYRDAFGNQIIDTSLTNTWTKSFTSSLNPLYTWINVRFGDYFYEHIPSGVNLTNQVTVNIYRDGNIIQSTGGPLAFCTQNPFGPGPNCPSNAVDMITKFYTCVP